MATATSIEPTIDESDQCVTLYGIGWDGYRRMLRMRGERSRPRMIYLDGDLLLMSPGHPHERDKDRFLVFVVEVAVALRLPFRMAGSTTYRRRRKRGGVEPDQSFYLANSPRVRNKREINLRVDPPPDLSIEVVYSHLAEAAVEVSRRLGIPEVWLCTERDLRFLVLGPEGTYRESATPLVFPSLTAPEILGWIRRPEGEDESDTEWVIELRRWVGEILVPRAAQRGE